ncbi:hypothetical protein BC937DRAFT_91169, partial [Endogone sp. FLAS-F59071]
FYIYPFAIVFLSKLFFICHNFHGSRPSRLSRNKLPLDQSPKGSLVTSCMKQGIERRSLMANAPTGGDWPTEGDWEWEHYIRLIY